MAISNSAVLIVNQIVGSIFIYVIAHGTPKYTISLFGQKGGDGATCIIHCDARAYSKVTAL